MPVVNICKMHGNRIENAVKTCPEPCVKRTSLSRLARI